MGTRRDIGEAHVKISGSSFELTRAVQQAQNTLGGFGKSLASGVIGSLGNLPGLNILAAGMAGGGLAAGIAAATQTARQFADAMAEAAKAADDLHDDAAALGASAGGLFGLRAASLGNTEALDTGLRKLSRDLGDALNGSEEAEKSFKKLGLTSEQLSKVPLNEAFLMIVDTMNQLPSQAQRSQAAFDIFGKQGQKLLEMIGKGREFTEGMQRAASAAGAIPSKALADSAEKWQVFSTKAGFAWQGIKNSVAEASYAILNAGVVDYMDRISAAFPGGGGPADDAAKAAAAAEAKAAFNVKVARRQQELLDEAKKMNEEFVRQGMTVGKSSDELKIYELKAKAGANATAELTRQLELNSRTLENNKRKADALKFGDDVLDPLERARKSLGQIADLKGLITKDQAGRGINKIADDIIAAAGLSAAAVKQPPSFIAPGSQEARSFVIDAERALKEKLADRGEKLIEAIGVLSGKIGKEAADVGRILSILEQNVGGNLKQAGF